jgi:hypothetical protein
MSSRFEFVSRLGSEFGNANPQDMKKVKDCVEINA